MLNRVIREMSILNGTAAGHQGLRERVIQRAGSRVIRSLNPECALAPSKPLAASGLVPTELYRVVHCDSVVAFSMPMSHSGHLPQSVMRFGSESMPAWLRNSLW
jgi:hypothetical protein